MLINLLETSIGEGLAIQYIDYGGYLLESYLQNVGPYPIYFTGAEMDYNGAWHNEAQDPDPDRVFDLYGWGHNYNNPIYDPSNVSAASYSHNFPSPKILYENQSEYYKWTYDRYDFNFWITPYVRSYPIPSRRTPTPSYNPGSIERLFYWNSDFQGVIKYEFRPDDGPVLQCEMDVTGKPGPEIKPTIYPSNTIGAERFYIRAVVEGNKDISGNDQNVNEVRFYVYNSSGDLVHYRRDTGSPYCIFGGSCTRYTPYVNTWSRGDLIVSDTYTLMIIAQNNDDGSRRKSEAIVETFVINAPTPTPTRTVPPSQTATITLSPTITRPPTITRTPTKTLIPSKTSPPTMTYTRTKTGTPTQTGTATKTPTRTATRTATQLQTATRTATKTSTPTPCLTPDELGGCR